ncbi:metal ABC transporter solute-binding protein, Zn/Mn family, partial [Campylobacter coli]
ALVQKYPQNKSLYKHNLDKFLTELDVLNLQISSKLQKLKNKDIKNLGALIKEKNIKVIFVQTRFPEKTAKTL